MFVNGRVILVLFILHGLSNCQSEDKKLIGDQSGFVSVAFRGMYSFKASSNHLEISYYVNFLGHLGLR